MSHVAVPNERGKEIEEHLSSIHLEPWFSRVQMSDEDFEGDEFEMAFCPYCEKLLEKPYWELQYGGVRGRCSSCEVIWNLT